MRMSKQTKKELPEKKRNPPEVVLITEINKNHKLVGPSHLSKLSENFMGETPLCGKKLTHPNLRTGGPVHRVECKACLKKYLKEYDKLVVSSAHTAYITDMKIQYASVSLFCNEAPFVKKVRLNELRLGDIFYMEQKRHDIDCDEADNGVVNVLYMVMGGPTVVTVNTKLEAIDWSVRVFPVPSIIRRLKEAELIR